MRGKRREKMKKKRQDEREDQGIKKNKEREMKTDERK